MAQIQENQGINLSFQATGDRGGDVSSQFDGKLTWSSSNPEFVDVSNGANSLAVQALAKGVGTSTVTASGTSDAGVALSATVTVDVVEAPPPPAETPVSAVIVEGSIFDQ